MKFPSIYYTAVLALLTVHAAGAVTSYNQPPQTSSTVTSYVQPPPSSYVAPATTGYPGGGNHGPGVQVLWGQCGGYYYYGTTICPTGAYCRYFSDWYSQCNPLSN